MAHQFVTNQFTVNGGVLGLDRSAMSRVVARSTVQSTGDGDHGAHAPFAVEPASDWDNVSHNLKTMIDQRVHYRNGDGVPVTIQAQIQRSRRTMRLSSPNFAFIRERYTHRVGVDFPTNVLAPEPDPTEIWNTEFGGGIDVGLEGGTPRYGQYRSSHPESSLMLEPVLLDPGQSIDVRYRASLITPFRWWQPELIPNFVARMEAFSNTILLWQYPEAV